MSIYNMLLGTRWAVEPKVYRGLISRVCDTFTFERTILLIEILWLWDLVFLDKIWRILSLFLFLLKMNSFASSCRRWMPIKRITSRFHLIVLVKVISIAPPIRTFCVAICEIIQFFRLMHNTFLFNWDVLPACQWFGIYSRLWFCIGRLHSTNERWARNSRTLWSLCSNMRSHFRHLSWLLHRLILVHE